MLSIHIFLDSIIIHLLYSEVSLRMLLRGKRVTGPVCDSILYRNITNIFRMKGSLSSFIFCLCFCTALIHISLESFCVVFQARQLLPVVQTFLLLSSFFPKKITVRDLYNNSNATCFVCGDVVIV